MSKIGNANRTNRAVTDQKVIDGLLKHQASIPSLFIDGKSVTVAEIVATVESRVTSANSVLSTRAAWLNAVDADRKTRASTHVFMAKVEQAIRVAFSGVDTLADFGMAPRKARAVTPAKHVEAAAKAKATRAARHTMGAVQREAVRGNVAGVVVTPVLSPSTGAGPSPAATPPIATNTAPPHA